MKAEILSFDEVLEKIKNGETDYIYVVDLFEDTVKWILRAEVKDLYKSRVIFMKATEDGD